jgi:rubrerythrin
MKEYKVPIQSLIDHIKTAIDVDSWAKEMAEELLKDQEAEWIYGEDETGVDGWRCSECGFFEPWFYEFDDDIDFIKRYEHCPKCGRRMTSYTGKQEGR